jgi:predicted permease
VLTVELARQLMPSKTPAETAELHRRLTDRLGTLPGVRSAAVAMCGVQRGCRSLNTGYTVEGYEKASPQEQIGFLINIVGPRYFDTMGMPIIEGRAIDGRDIAGSTPVVVVNETAARKYFAGHSAVGKRIGMDGKLTNEIAGVVRDARVLGVRDEPTPMAYYAMVQMRETASAVEIRTQGDPRPLIATVRRALTEAAPDVPVNRIVVMADQVNANLNQERLVANLSSAFGALALGLAGFGLFGTLSFAVARRTAEFGIRMALGASGGAVVWSVCREALVMVLAGVALGLPAVLFGSRAMRTLLFGVTAHDWSAFAGAGAVLVAVAAIAGLLPAWRASRVDPVIALRME